MDNSEILSAIQNPDAIIELKNHMGKIVGAVYAKTVDPTKIVISSATAEEKYFLYYQGIGIYFSTWAKLG